MSRTMQSFLSQRLTGFHSTVVCQCFLLLLSAPVHADTDMPAPEQPVEVPASDGNTTDSASVQPSDDDATLGTALDQTQPGDELDALRGAIDAGEAQRVEREITAYIEQVEQATSRYSPELIKPLVILGDAQMELAEYEAAAESYGRAVHVDRVANGLHSPTQADIVYRESAALKALGDYQEAGNREEYAYELLVRRYGEGSLEALPATFRLADWCMQTDNVLLARSLFNNARTILLANEALHGEQAYRALRGLAATFKAERFPTLYQRAETDTLDDDDDFSRASRYAPLGQATQLPLMLNSFPLGEKSLNQIVTLMLVDPASTPGQQADAMTDLADWYLMFDHPEKALPLYVKAAEQYAIADPGAPAAFSAPTLLYFPLPPPLKPPPESKRGPPMEGFVQLTVTVKPDGTVTDMVTVADAPHNAMEFRVRRSMKIARYRPAIQDGQFVGAGGLAFEHRYPWFAPLPDQTRSDDATTPDTDTSAADAPADMQKRRAVVHDALPVTDPVTLEPTAPTDTPVGDTDDNGD